MRILHIQHRGTWYKISLEKATLGHVMQYGEHRFPLPNWSWRILGFSTHHWHRSITIPLTPDIAANVVKNCLVWDKDHGTTRIWGGSYCGKLPRVQSAYITEGEDNE